MTDNRPLSPTVARRRLGRELERLRGRRTQSQAAELLGFSLGKLKYLEWGTRPLSRSDLEHRVVPGYGVPPGERPLLVDLCDQANTRAWWEEYDDADVPAELRRYIGYEQGAAQMRDFQTVLFPGLLHSEPYALAVIRDAVRASSPRIDVLTELRLRRQQALLGPRPVGLHAIVDEAVLYRQVGGPEIMREQLLFVADLAERLPHLTVQVIPFEVGAYRALGGSFNLIDFGTPGDPGVVHLEHGSAGFVEARSEIYAFAQSFDERCTLALPPPESLAMLRNVAYGRRAIIES
jgi:hypothetical protein